MTYSIIATRARLWQGIWLTCCKPSRRIHKCLISNTKTIRKKSMTDFTRDKEKLAQATQGGENERAEIVVVHLPQGTSFLTSLNPEGNLLEEPIYPDELRRDHEGFQSILKEKGCRVYMPYDVLSEASPAEREVLITQAMASLKYELHAEGARITPKMKYCVSDEYKHKVLSALSNRNLVDVILSEPIIHLAPGSRNTALVTKSVEIHDSNNMVFMRDQQITTRRGVIMGQFQAPQRRREQILALIFWKCLGVRVVGDCREGGPNCMLEGGDFIPASPGLSMMGIGLRSTYVGAHYLMSKDLLGVRRFAVVKDCFDQHQDRMHLDCICSVIHDKLVVLDEYVCSGMGLRYVDEWIDIGADATKKVKSSAVTCGNYVLARANIELQQWFSENGYTIIRIPHEYQLAYGCNNLNLGNNCVLSVHQPTVDFIKKNPEYISYCKSRNLPNGLDLVYVPFRGITRMYGSLHCASQVIYRTPSTPAAVTACEQEGDKVAAMYEKNNEPVDAAGKKFDCVLYIPSGIDDIVDSLGINLGDDAAPSREIIADAYRLYQRLLSEGRVPYIMWRMPSTPVVSIKAAAKAGSLKAVLDKIPQLVPFTPKAVQGAAVAYTRYLGLDQADICVDIK